MFKLLPHSQHNENLEYMRRIFENLSVNNNGKQDVYKTLSGNMSHEITLKWSRKFQMKMTPENSRLYPK